MWFSGYCSPRYESENRTGFIVKSAKCSFHLLALYSGAINHLFVISIHGIKLMNALNRNMISLPKFHSFIVWFKDICLDLMFALILPGSPSEITCRPDRYAGHPICRTYDEISWNNGMQSHRSGSSNWSAASGEGAKLPCGHLADQHGIDKHVSPRPSIDLPV